MAWLKWRGTPGRGKWNAVWTETIAGKRRKRFRAISKNRKTAEAILKEIELNIERKALGLGQVVTLQQLKHDYLALLASNGGAKSYLERIEIAMNHLDRHFPHLKVSAITVRLMDEYKIKRIFEKIDPSTINREVDFIKAAVKKAKRFQYQFNDLTEVGKVKGIEKNRTGFKPAEITAILGESRKYPPLYVVSMLGLYAGLRRSEILFLRWRDIDTDQRVITLGDEWKTKSGRMRAVPINRKLVAAIEAWHATPAGKEISVIPWTKSPHLFSSLYTYFLRHRCRIERGSLHTLRHTFITELKRNDMDTAKIQRLAGHTSEKTTQGYVHLDVNDLKKGVDELNYEGDAAQIGFEEKR